MNNVWIMYVQCLDNVYTVYGLNIRLGRARKQLLRSRNEPLHFTIVQAAEESVPTPLQQLSASQPAASLQDSIQYSVCECINNP